MKQLVAHIGSLRHTLALMGLLAAVVLASPTRWPLSLAVGALALNLCAALALHPLLRRQALLLVAHLALLVLVVAVALGRLMALDGRFELTQGEFFEGELLDRDAGPLHVERLQALRFRHDGFEIDYAPGRKRGATRNAVTWHDGQGRAQSAVIGDHHPLVLAGHRIYTSPNKGFAPLLRWQPTGGPAQRGAVHLPSFPAQELHQSREWQLPGGPVAWVMLQIDEPLIAADKPARFSLPSRPQLVLRVGAQRAVLAPGEGVDLPGGRLVFEELRTWMGYRVAYDPTLPWLLVSALVATLALAGHYVQKFGAGAAVSRAHAAGGEVQHG